MNALRPLMRRALYRSGALRWMRHPQTLTAIMLHRVMDPADPDYAYADPVYTLSTSLFDRLLDFLRTHYAVVSLGDVMAAYDGARALPEHALLITFDDGWADNLRYAAPLLQQHRLPAVVFAVAEPIRSEADVWWQERVFHAARHSGLPTELCESSRAEPAFDAMARLGLMAPAKRDALLQAIPDLVCRRRMMLRPEDLPALVDRGIDIGLHGYSHVPLTMVPDVTIEVQRARDAIAAMSGGAATCTALGCPHGRYDESVIAAARAAGVKLVFTSDPWLNVTRDGRLGRSVLGRVNVIARHIEGSSGRFDPSAAARWLWARETRG